VPHETLAALIDHAERGGTVIFVGELPEDVPGLGRLEERRAAFAATLARLRWPDQDRGPRQATIGTGRVVVVADAAGVVTGVVDSPEPLAARACSDVIYGFVSGVMDEVTATTEYLGPHAKPLKDGLRSLQLAFRESSAAPDEPGFGPGESLTGPVR
jgi:hypothetical protein